MLSRIAAPREASGLKATEHSVTINVRSSRPFRPIPSNFIGLGYETSAVAVPGLLSATNHTYVQLVRSLGAQGVIRIGGNTSDYAVFAADGTPVSAPKSSVLNENNLRELGTFLEATGWDLIWGLNLGQGTEQEAVEEAREVMAAVRGKLLAFEIGNEPDLFGKNAHRERGYSYQDYLLEYRRFKAAVRRETPAAAFAGPDVAGATDWVTRFAADEGADLRLLTHHYYRECSNPASTCAKLLRRDPKLAPELAALKSASASSQVPYRICETNSFCGGGKPGVSNTFCSALWALDFLFTLASADAGGINIETGVNQLGFVSSYSPIAADEPGVYLAKPEYYGMLAFAQASRGRRVELTCDAENPDLTTYAVLDDRDKRLIVTLINKNVSLDVTVKVITDRNSTHATVLRLSGPSLDSKEGITLGGSSVTSNGHWKPAFVEPLHVKDGQYHIHVPATSAALAALH